MISAMVLMAITGAAAAGLVVVDGTDADERLFGSEEDDAVTGGEGNDRISVDDGDDVVDAGGGDDAVDGNFGDDLIAAGDGNDTVFAGRGDDLVSLGAGDDTVTAGRGDDIIEGEDGDDTILGQRGDDVLIGGDGSDSMEGGFGSDLFVVDASQTGQDSILDFDLLDQLVINSATPLAEGDISFEDQDDGSRNLLIGDVVVANLTGDVADLTFSDILIRDLSITGVQPEDIVNGTPPTETEPETGTEATEGDDVLIGTSEADTIDALAGNDVLVGAGGPDTLTGGAGDDLFVINPDFILGAEEGEGGPVQITDYQPSDQIVLDNDQPLSDVIDLVDNGDGTKTITLGETDIAVISGETADLSSDDLLFRNVTGSGGTGTAYADILNGTPPIDPGPEDPGGTQTGTDGDDVLLGTDNSDELIGLGGNDQLNGSGGNDVLSGGDGTDLLEGGDGDDGLFSGPGTGDVLIGGNGDDELIAEAGSIDAALIGGSGDDDFVIEEGAVDVTVADYEEGELLEFFTVAGASETDYAIALTPAADASQPAIVRITPPVGEEVVITVTGPGVLSLALENIEIFTPIVL